MIDKVMLRHLIKEKNEIDEMGRQIQAQALAWTKNLKECVGDEPFTKDGIDWCKIGLMLTEDCDSECHDRCVCNDRV